MPTDRVSLDVRLADLPDTAAVTDALVALVVTIARGERVRQATRLGGQVASSGRKRRSSRN